MMNQTDTKTPQLLSGFDFEPADPLVRYDCMLTLDDGHLNKRSMLAPLVDAQSTELLKSMTLLRAIPTGPPESQLANLQNIGVSLFQLKINIILLKWTP